MSPRRHLAAAAAEAEGLPLLPKRLQREGPPPHPPLLGRSYDSLCLCYQVPPCPPCLHVENGPGWDHLGRESTPSKKRFGLRAAVSSLPKECLWDEGMKDAVGPPKLCPGIFKLLATHPGRTQESQGEEGVPTEGSLSCPCWLEKTFLECFL